MHRPELVYSHQGSRNNCLEHRQAKTSRQIHRASWVYKGRVLMFTQSLDHTVSVSEGLQQTDL